MRIRKNLKFRSNFFLKKNEKLENGILKTQKKRKIKNVGFSAPGRPKSASGLRFSESP